MVRIEDSQSSDAGFESRRSDSLSNICKPLLTRIAVILPINRLTPRRLKVRTLAFQASNVGFKSHRGDYP